MKRAAILLALILPVAGLAALWAWTESWTREGTDWEVPVGGYDPRDLLRGHYIEFTYDWPVEGEDEEERFWIEALCIEGEPPVIERVVIVEDLAGCEHFAKADRGGVYGMGGLTRGRLYVPQTQASELEDKLRDPELRGIVTVRQRVDGRILPQSIRFRALTEEERAERDRPADEPADDTQPAIEVSAGSPRALQSAP